ncbi:MAG: heavy metal translocating P-type ATPase [Fastidiosipilaceae bacterium]|jgi:Cd2+/Zn2+-exporting ATPase|nr:heavy metal translocating P-type ATPase [Clostridiaceae bacterium]
MKKRLIRIIVSAVLFVLGLVVAPVLSVTWPRIVIFVAAYLLVGTEILIKAAKSIRRGQVFNEFFLMAIATLGAMALQEYAEATAVMLFYQVGELFQDYAVGKSRRSISALMDIWPETANLEQDGEVVEVDPEDVPIDSIIVIRPGERVPLDGIVLSGQSRVDTAALTGEPVPRSISEGDEIISGFVNIEGVLRVKVTKDFENASVTKILELVEEAGTRKSKTEHFISKFAMYYTPVVVIAAVILAILPPLLFDHGNFKVWIHRALLFLVVSCPCALVISIPLSFFGGIGGSSREGILVKGSNYLEALSNVHTVVMDKTGTLTKGVFSVQEVYPRLVTDDRNTNDVSTVSVQKAKEDIILVAAAAEQHSNHPIAISLSKAAEVFDRSLVHKTKVIQEVAGHGVEAEVDGRKIFVGNRRWMEKNAIKGFVEPDVSHDIAGTIIYVAQGDEYMGAVFISDALREDAKETLQGLRNQGVDRLVMLTGDRREAAEKVANSVGITEAHSELLPQDKVTFMDRILDDSKKKSSSDQSSGVAFVGDGINDAPALALADVGIAMGGLGQDAAIEAADIVILNDQLSKLVTAIEIAKRTVRIARQNVVFALTIKFAVLILGAIGIATMWSAVFADVGVTIIAILNSMRNLRKMH